MESILQTNKETLLDRNGEPSSSRSDHGSNLSLSGVGLSGQIIVSDRVGDGRKMSAVGQKRKSSVGLGMSALGGKANLKFGSLDVCL